MEIEDFLPKYPYISSYQNDDLEILNPYRVPFNDAIVSKKEFSELKLEKNERIQGGQYNHQKIISRFLASMTPYNEILLFHEMGTGKTCTAIGAIEQLRYDKHSNINNAIILARGRNLLKNFAQELIFTCTGGKYIPENYERLSDLERSHRINKITSEFYSFFTFEIFAKNITNLSDDEIVKRFSNSIIILDEVHNIREKEEVTRSEREQLLFRQDPLYVYKQIHRFLHLVKESKIILLSGTVMKDDPSEFASIINLILPLSNQFSVDNFNLEYFENNKFKPDKVQDFTDKIRGRTSYLKAMSSDVKKVFNGQKLGSLQHFLVYPDWMSDFQSMHYSNARERDLSERSIFISSRQASLFVFPDGSYGSEGFDRYISSKGRGGAMTFSLNSELIKLIRGPNYNIQLKNLAKYSSKYAATIGNIISTPKTKALVYSKFVSGGGAILFSKILELFGFSRANGNETTKSPRYAILTTQTSNQNKIQAIINRFNNEDNLDGEFISVIIGSDVISEGFTLKNIRQEFILTPHWNFSETSQVIARGWRIGSHHSLIKRGDKDLKVNVYLQTSIPSNSIPSIDLVMYEKSEQKDYLMKQIEYLVKTTSFDCPLTYDRNRVSLIYNNTRDCEYNKCDYKCDGTILETDKITYNLYYISSQIVKKRLLDYFKTENFITFSKLFSLLNELSIFEIVYSVKSLIDTDFKIYNKYGQVSYLRVCTDFLFITTDVKTRNDDIFATYYTTNNIIGNCESFDDINETIYEERIPNMIQTLFDFSTEEIMIPEIMSALPEKIQVFILQSCIKARFQKLKKNYQPRENILNQYKGFYSSFVFDSTEWWIVWMYKERYGITCFNGGEWRDYLTQPQEFIDFVNHTISKTKDRLLKSPVGFYGLYNPQLNDFCLRDVKSVTSGKDLRKIAVGKRCVDFKYGTLLNLLVKDIKAPYKPVDYLSPLNDRELLKALKEKKVDFTRDPTHTDFENTETMKRYLYWSDRKRPELCKHIQIWMEENDLVESSFDCGTQQKQRRK